MLEISHWENPGIDVYSIPGICQPARKSSGIDFFGNGSLGAPVNMQMAQICKYKKSHSN